MIQKQNTKENGTEVTRVRVQHQQTGKMRETTQSKKKGAKTGKCRRQTYQ
jgi:hypothetical protein